MVVAHHTRNSAQDDARIKAVLGPTNTGKTHLAIERLCAHSSGVIGFPLRLLAREVYDRVCAIKGENRVALITGEERIEPPDARWRLCTVEAMPVESDAAFVALDEAQLGADRERGHVFTDRLLHARGREETMILGSATLEPLVRALVPKAEIVSRPRFSTLTHIGPRKLSRLPARSVIVAFSVEQVYAIAEMLRRFRGGAAVVMGALSPQTRNAQVALYQSGEVDYLVATDAIGMGLNLDVGHVAFAGLSKFDGVRQRRLTPAEMAQIAGRAGRHQRDGTFGVLAGGARHDVTFTDEEVHAIEEHRFAPLSRLFWRDAEPRLDSLGTLVADLEALPDRPELAPAPEAIDLAVLKRLADDPAASAGVSGKSAVARFWDVCRLPDFRQHGAETHARFVARLWEDLRHGELKPGFVAQAIAQLDNPQGDIDTLQGRIAAVRSWSYITQRPDWVQARHEMAARARGVEDRLSDALHARLAERFVNRRTSVLMRNAGPDAGLLPVALEGDSVLVDGEHIGTLDGLRFRIDPQVRHADRKLLLAAADRHVPALLDLRAQEIAKGIGSQVVPLSLAGGRILAGTIALASLAPGRNVLAPRITPDAAVVALPPAAREAMVRSLESWLARRLAPLAALHRLEAASRDEQGGPELRALLIRLVESGGVVARAESGIDRLDRAQRHRLARLGVTVGSLDLFVAPMLRPAAAAIWRELATMGQDTIATLDDAMRAMRPVLGTRAGLARPFGYRRIADQWLRVDLAERLLRDAHAARAGNRNAAFPIRDTAATSMGLAAASHAALLRLGGFRSTPPRPLADGAYGPPRPQVWRWRPPRARRSARAAHAQPVGNAFAILAGLVR